MSEHSKPSATDDQCEHPTHSIVFFSDLFIQNLSDAEPDQSSIDDNHASSDYAELNRKLSKSHSTSSVQEVTFSDSTEDVDASTTRTRKWSTSSKTRPNVPDLSVAALPQLLLYMRFCRIKHRLCGSATK